jgi:hypothetical protein
MANNDQQDIQNLWGPAPGAGHNVWGQGLLGLVQPQEEEDAIVPNNPAALQQAHVIAHQVANAALPPAVQAAQLIPFPRRRRALGGGKRRTKRRVRFRLQQKKKRKLRKTVRRRKQRASRTRVRRRSRSTRREKRKE